MHSWGFLLPVWLLGFPLLLAIVDRARIGGPRGSLSSDDFSASRRMP